MSANTPLDNLKSILAQADAAAAHSVPAQEEAKIACAEPPGLYVEKIQLKTAWDKINAIPQDMIFIDQLEPILHSLYEKI